MSRRPIVFDEAPSLILAIDVGNKGALAWINVSGSLIDVLDMPVMEIRNKNRVSGALLKVAFKRYPLSFVIIEQASGMPHKGKGKDGEETETKMGVGSAGTLFYGAGMIEGIAIGLGVPYEIIHSRTWKTRSGTPADKGACRQMAQRYWPDHADKFKLKKNDGRADAALLGRWTSLKMRGQ